MVYLLKMVDLSMAMLNNQMVFMRIMMMIFPSVALSVAHLIYSDTSMPSYVWSPFKTCPQPKVMA